MNSSSSIKKLELARRYQSALSRYLKGGPAASLRPAVKLGREAIALGLETLDLTLIHEQALITQALPIRSVEVRARLVRRTGAFFAEAILPMEKTHRAAIEANIHLSELNQALSRRTRDLAASNRQLK
jgi:hypothetical protein